MAVGGEQKGADADDEEAEEAEDDDDDGGDAEAEAFGAGKPAPDKKLLAGKIFAITGTLSKPRKFFHKIISVRDPHQAAAPQPADQRACSRRTAAACSAAA